MYLYLDIETIPTQREDVRDHIAESVHPPANYSKPETVAKWALEKKPEAVEEAVAKTALDGTFGEVVCIGWAFGDAEAVCIHREDGQEELSLLGDFLFYLNDLIVRPGATRNPTIVGHNVTNFDLPFLWQRCVVHGIPWPSYFPKVPELKPYGNNRGVEDTMLIWPGKFPKQDDLCLALGIPRQTGIDGSQVWEAVKDGRIQEVVDHCRADVEQVREIHRRLR